jgi:hypothetical protein
VQHAVEEIDDIPEFSISQSVAARAIVKSTHNMNNMKPFFRFGLRRVPWALSVKRKRRGRDEERFTKDIILLIRDVGVRAWAILAGKLGEIFILSKIFTRKKVA